jgi:hypothetical protein
MGTEASGRRLQPDPEGDGRRRAPDRVEQPLSLLAIADRDREPVSVLHPELDVGVGRERDDAARVDRRALQPGPVPASPPDARPPRVR